MTQGVIRNHIYSRRSNFFVLIEFKFILSIHFSSHLPILIARRSVII